MNEEPKFLQPLRDDQLDEEARKAVQAARRSAEKLRKRKRLLGYKILVRQNNEMIRLDP